MAPPAATVLIGAVTALTEAGMRVRAGCELVGLPRSTFYRLTRNYQHYQPVQHPIRQKDRYQPAALDQAERQAVITGLSSPACADLSVGQAYWHLMDNTQLGISRSSFYRVAREHRLVGDRRATRKPGRAQPARHKPIVHASTIGDLWSWDITELKGPRSQDRYKLYLSIDVYSRLPVAWRIEYSEDTAKVVQMFALAFAVHGIPGCLHADNGPSMRSNALAAALETAGVIPSFSRPRVSDDNPFSESLFKTIKYDHAMPDRFDSIEHAREWTQTFLDRYANEHRHSGIGYYTPASIHNGTAAQVQHQRQTTLDLAWTQNPQRFARRPLAPALPQPTGINTHLSQTG